ncbi:MAG: hypothetical protein R3C11_24265 [Planctomycetaceae bacterium]
MTTTNLFVELLVIGVGAACWIVLTVMGVFGLEWVHIELLQNYSVVVVLLALVYLLGIITDRLADYVFDKLFSAPLRARYFNEKREYQNARRLIFSTSDRLADMHEYGRTRIRICRGWAVNAYLVAISFNFFLYNQYSTAEWYRTAMLTGTTAALLLSFASWMSWRMLCSTEYLKIREHADFLRHQNSLTTDNLVSQYREAA